MIGLEKEQQVAILTLASEDGKNLISQKTVNRLHDIQEEIHDDQNVRSVVLTGSGSRVFCQGTDERELRTSQGPFSIRDWLSVGAIVEKFRRPVIAAINGAALGQGLELALACDLRVCSETATFGMPQVSRGEMPWDGGTQRLSRILGRGKALEMILTGESIDAAEAFRTGLVQHVAPSGELMNVALRIAKRIAAQSPVAVAYAREALYKGSDMTLEQGLRLEADLYYLIHTMEDRKEGIKAFKEKRAARFEGLGTHRK